MYINISQPKSWDLKLMPSSSVAERVTVNHDVAGSNPASAAKLPMGQF